MGRADGVRLAADGGKWMHALRAEPIGRFDFQSKVEAVALAMAPPWHTSRPSPSAAVTTVAEAATVHAGRPISTRDVGKVVKRLGENGLVVVLVAGRAPLEGEARTARFPCTR